MRDVRIVFCVLVLILTAAGVLHAQDTIEIGTKPFGAYNAGNLDVISVESGQLALKIPLISYPQRGGKLQLNYYLRYVNAGAQTAPQCIYIAYGNYYICYAVPVAIGGWCDGDGLYGAQYLCHGFQVVDENSLSLSGGTSCYGETNGICEGNTRSVSILAPDGGMHKAEPISGNSSYSTWETVDATAYRIIVPNNGTPGTQSTIVDPDGTEYILPSSGSGAYRQDANGNMITYPDSNGYSTGVGATDTMGRTIPSFPTASSDTTGCPVPPEVPYTPSSAATWTPPDVNGGTYPILFCYVQLTETDPVGDGCVPGDPPPTYCSANTYTANELQSVVLPDESSWTFEYTTDGNADLAKVVFPTGGSLSYSNWTAPPNWNSEEGGEYSRIVGTRTLDPNDGVTPPSTWTYAGAGTNGMGVSSPPSVGSTPDDTVYTFGGPVWGVPTQVQYYQGSQTNGTLLKTTATQYSSLSDLQVGVINLVPIQTTTTWANGQQSKTTYTYDSGFQFCYPFFSASSPYALNGGNDCNAASGIFGRQLTKNEYDYSGTLLRTTTTSWMALNNSSYLKRVSSIPLEVERRFSDPIRIESGCKILERRENRREKNLSQQLAEEHHHDPQERHPSLGPFFN